jgi:transcription elongation factor GreA
MSDKKYYLTKEGLEKIKKEHEELKNQRKEKLRFEAPEMSCSEDADSEYLNFKKDLGLLEERILKLEDAIRSVEMIETPLINCKEIRLGAEVVIDIKGKEDKILLVGTMEADPSSGKISNESPVGKALFGRREGDFVTISSERSIVYKIKKISYPKS